MAREKYTIDATTLKDIGDAIRTKRGISTYVAVADFADEILKIQSTEQEPPYDICTYDESGHILTAQYVGVAQLPAYHHYQNINIQSVVADESLTGIGAYCFQGNTALAKVDASGLQKIGAHAFNGCTALSELDLWAVKEIGTYGLNGCTALVVDSLPELETVTAYALTGADVRELSIPACKTIEGNGLNGLTKLESLDAPQVESLGTQALLNCASLKDVRFPRVMTINSSKVFRYCVFERLAFDIIGNIPYNSNASDSVFLGASVDILDLGSEITYIANRVFTSMTKKPRIIIIRNEEEVCELQGVTQFSLYDSDPENPPMILVPESMVESYQEATNWATFADMIYAGEDYPEYWEY